MARREWNCGICEAANQPAHCVACVKIRVAEKLKFRNQQMQERNQLKRRLDAALAKKEAEKQERSKNERADHAAKLRDQLKKSKQKLEKYKLLRVQKERGLEAGHARLRVAEARLAAMRTELVDKSYPELIETQNNYASLNSTLFTWREKQIQILCKIYPLSQGDSGKLKGKDLSRHVRICGVPLPLGDDPSSVGPVELSASLGYMVHLVSHLAIYLSAPLLYEGAFAASSSRIWQRASYWDSKPTKPTSLSEYPLFLPRKGGRSILKTPDKQGSLSGSGFLSLEKPASLMRSKSSDKIEGESSADKDVKQGLKLLKANIQCICAVGFKMLSLPMPSNMSTFETFMELLSILKGSKTKRLNRPSNIGMGGSLLQSGFSSQIKDSETVLRKNKIAIVSDFFCISESTCVDEWDVIDHPILPPPSQTEDVEHWTRAMILDARK